MILFEKWRILDKNPYIDTEDFFVSLCISFGGKICYSRAAR